MVISCIVGKPPVRHPCKYAAVSMSFRYSSKRGASLQNVTYFIGVHYSLNVRYVTCSWPLGNCNMFKTGFGNMTVLATAAAFR